jgi:hypothetical protein
MRRFFSYIRNFLIQKNISIYTKVIKLLKIEIEKLTSNFSLPSLINEIFVLNLLSIFLYSGVKYLFVKLLILQMK